jgi:hypothetical protein
MILLLLAVAVVIGCLLMHLIEPAGKLGPRWAAILVELGLGAGFGIALVSLIFFLLLAIHEATAAVMLPTEVALFLASSILVFVGRKRETANYQGGSAGISWLSKMLSGMLVAGFFLVTAALARTAHANRFGSWDSWNIWNLRAKYLTGLGDTWTRAFSTQLNYFSHPDYPLLLSGFVGQVWKFSGRGTPTLVPILTAAVFIASVAALLVGALALMRGSGLALLAGLILISSSSFLGQAMSQYADVPLSFYYLATIVVLVLSEYSDGARKSILIALAGAFASFGAWTKNEGLVFLPIALICFLLVSWSWRRATSFGTKWFLPILGAAPTLFVVGYFKLFLAPPGDMGGQPLPQILHKMTELSRYWIIGKSLIARALELGEWWAHPLLLMAILVCFLRIQPGQLQKQEVVTGWLCLILLFFAYCGVYVITPLDLRFHLSTSLTRLYCQMWPSFLFLVFLILRSPEELSCPGGLNPQTKEIS